VAASSGGKLAAEKVMKNRLVYNNNRKI